MKTAIIPLVLLVLLPVYGTLSSPPGFLKEFKNDSAILTLQKFQSQYDSLKFYEESNLLIDSLNLKKKNKKIIEDKEKKRNLIILYFITKMPLYSVDSMEIYSVAVKSLDLDLTVKRKALSFLTSKQSVDYLPDSPDIKKLCIEYSTKIMCDFNTIIHEGLKLDKSKKEDFPDQLKVEYENKREKVANEIYRQILQAKNTLPNNEILGKITDLDNERLQKYQTLLNEYKSQIGMYNVQRRRYLHLKGTIMTLEKPYVSMLLRLLPKKTVEIKQQLRNAGYPDKEINSLLNRTEGRSAHTEFLYKGKNRNRIK